MQMTGKPTRDGDTLEHDKDEAVVGFPKTTKARAPPISELCDEARETETVKLVLVASGVVEKVKLEPPFFDVKEESDKDEEETAKSAAIPVVAPLLPETLIVQITPNPTREGEPLMHDTVETEVGKPNTAKLTFPLVIGALYTDD